MEKSIYTKLFTQPNNFSLKKASLKQLLFLLGMTLIPIFIIIEVISKVFN